MWIDTHAHLDAAELSSDCDAVIARAEQAGVGRIVIPAIAAHNLETVRVLAHRFAGGRYALGIHPLLTPQAQECDLAFLRAQATAALRDERFVAIGEIGLDYFVESLRSDEARAKQEHFYVEQLRIARDLDLPVLLHVRRSQDRVLKYLRQIQVCGGIAHAFNGSTQQAAHYVAMGFALGFGGAMTFERALRIREIAVTTPIDDLVLETDSPDIPPAWLRGERNEPAHLPRIGAVLAQLRGITADEIAQITEANARRVLPRLS